MEYRYWRCFSASEEIMNSDFDDNFLVLVDLFLRGNLGVFYFQLFKIFINS